MFSALVPALVTELVTPETGPELTILNASERSVQLS